MRETRRHARWGGARAGALLLAALVPERIRLIGDEAPVRYGMALVVGLLLYLVAPLVWHSFDPIFAILAVGLILIAAYARHAFPRATGRGAPVSEPAAT